MGFYVYLFIMTSNKFKVWDKINNCWFVPTYRAHEWILNELLINQNGDLVRHTMNGFEHESVFAWQYIVCRYTWLKDRKGVEIYEGDIIQSTWNSWIYSVERNEKEWEWYYCRDCDGQSKYKESIVIWNIYENPELK